MAVSDTKYDKRDESSTPFGDWTPWLLGCILAGAKRSCQWYTRDIERKTGDKISIRPHPKLVIRALGIERDDRT